MQNHIDRISDFELMSKFESPEALQETSTINKLIESVKYRNHVILCGPPGTGKTRAIDQLLERLNRDISYSEVVQFHPSYSYQDFIEGYSISDGKYQQTKGLLLKFLDSTKDLNEDKLKILIIDEINRGDIPSIFGELMMLLDRDCNRSVKTSKFGNNLSLPKNFIIVGAMNTADRNIKQLDLALRRRFKFIFVPPDYNGLTEWLHTYSFSFDDFSISEYVEAIRRLNNRIIKHPLLGKNMALGQSLFVPNVHSSITLKSLTNIFNEIVFPQIEAYIGLGNRKELDNLFGTPDIRIKLDLAIDITELDLIHLMNTLNTSQD